MLLSTGHTGHTTWIPDLVNMSPVHAPSQLLHKHWISLGQRSDCWPAVKVFMLGRLSLWLISPPFWYLSWWYNKQKSWSLCSWSIYNVWVYIDINLNCSSFHHSWLRISQPSWLGNVRGQCLVRVRLRVVLSLAANAGPCPPIIPKAVIAHASQPACCTLILMIT